MMFCRPVCCRAKLLLLVGGRLRELRLLTRHRKTKIDLGFDLQARGQILLRGVEAVHFNSRPHAECCQDHRAN